MRCALLFVAGCGFQGADVTNAGGDGPAKPIDAPLVMFDAPIAIDAAIPVDAKVPADAFVDPSWPCGPQPSPPPDPMQFGNSTTSLKISGLSLDGARTAVEVIGATPKISFDWFIHDSACQQCRDQIEYGWVDATGAGKRRGCIFDGFMSFNSKTASDSVNTTIGLPPAPGQYTLRVALTEEDSCNDHSDWASGSPPPDSHTIAIVCVH